MSNKECEIVQDLLPLYYDKACSEASCSFVEKHMAGCSDCQKIYNELQENNVDEVLAKVKEKNASEPEFLQAVTEVLESLRPCLLYTSPSPRDTR